MRPVDGVEDADRVHDARPSVLYAPTGPLGPSVASFDLKQPSMHRPSVDDPSARTGEQAGAGLLAYIPSCCVLLNPALELDLETSLFSLALQASQNNGPTYRSENDMDGPDYATAIAIPFRDLNTRECLPAFQLSRCLLTIYFSE